MVARYWGHVFGGKVLRVDGIGGQGSGGTVLRARYCGQSIKSRRYWGTGYWGHGIVDKVLRVDGVGGQGSGGTVLGARFCGQSIKGGRYWGTG